MRRRHAAATLLGAALATSWVPPRAAGALDLETAIGLANLMQLSAAVDETDKLLAARLLVAPKAPSASPGVPTEDGDAALARVRALMKEYRPRELGAAAAGAALKARLCTAAKADELARHGKEADERLAAILERSAIDRALSVDALGRRAPTVRPAELLFVHRTLVAARDEVDAAIACVGSGPELQEAVRFSGVAARRPPPSASGLPPLPGEPGYSLYANEADEIIAQAILRLPSGKGTALFRSDAQNAENNEYQQRMQNGRTRRRAAEVEARPTGASVEGEEEE